MNEKPHGLMPPMITAFDKKGEIDKRGIRNIVKHLEDGGVDGLIPCGSTGEFPTLSLDERKKVIETVIEEADEETLIYAGTHHLHTDKAIELSKFAENKGADGLFVLPPYYISLPKEGIRSYYERISKETEIPIMLYHNPNFSGIELPPDFISEMYEENLINSVKEAHGPAWRIHDEIAQTDENFQVLYGHDQNGFEALAAGADGWVCGLANLIPEPISEIVHLSLENKLEKARELWYNILPIINLAVKEWNGEPSRWIALIKEGLKMRDVNIKAIWRYQVPSLPKEKREDLREMLEE